MMPDSIRFLLIIAGIIGSIYAAAFLLASLAPQPRDVTKELSDAPLRKQS